MNDKNETDYNWMEHAPESVLSPDIIFGFDFDTEDPQADRNHIKTRLLGGAETMKVRGFSNQYAKYVNLDGMLAELEGYANALSQAEALKEELKLKRWIFWWTPGVYAHERDRFLDICSMRTLNACESFLKSIVSTKTDRTIATGSRADYNDFDYSKTCLIERFEGQLYYADFWERGYVSDERFEAKHVDEPWEYNTYRDPDFETFQGKAEKVFEQFSVLKAALVDALGDEVLTRKYFNV